MFLNKSNNDSSKQTLRGCLHSQRINQNDPGINPNEYQCLNIVQDANSFCRSRKATFVDFVTMILCGRMNGKRQINENTLRI